MDNADKTAKKKTLFLSALSEGFSITGAARTAQFSRATAYRWRGEDAEFAASWDGSLEEGTDVLEDEAKRRALAGSDTLLIFLLKARRPDKYKDRYEAKQTVEIADSPRKQIIDDLTRIFDRERAERDPEQVQ